MFSEGSRKRRLFREELAEAQQEELEFLSSETPWLSKKNKKWFYCIRNNVKNEWLIISNYVTVISHLR
jgi:hypothetical protein